MPDPSDDSTSQAMPSGNIAVPAGGYKPMKAKPDADKYTPAPEVANAKLPPKVDLRPFMTPVEDQGQTMSCVANAVAGAYEYGVKRVTKKDTDVSRLFVYYNARWRDKDQENDGGCRIQYAMEGLQRFGTCAEKTWPFKTPMILTKPNQSSYKEGVKGKVSTMKQVPVELKAWKQCLAEGSPIVFGTVLFESFNECSENHGIVPMPSPDDVGRSEHGGHSMLCVGYSDVEEVFIVRNSWGKTWGDKGYCYMPYDYLMNPKFNDGDCWIFTPPTNLIPTPVPPAPHRPPALRPHPGPHHPPYRPPHPVPYVPLPAPKEFWIWDDTPVVDAIFWSTYSMVTYNIEAYESVEFSFFEEYTVEWSSVVDEEYTAYSEWSYEERFEEMEEYSLQEVTEEYTSQTGETNYSTGKVSTAMAAVAAGAVGLAAIEEFSREEDSTDQGESLTEQVTADVSSEAAENAAEDAEAGEDDAEDREGGVGDDSAEENTAEEGEDDTKDDADIEKGDGEEESDGDDDEEEDDAEEGGDEEGGDEEGGDEEGGDEEGGDEEGGDEEEDDAEEGDDEEDETE